MLPEALTHLSSNGWQPQRSNRRSCYCSLAVAGEHAQMAFTRLIHGFAISLMVDLW